MNNKGKIAIGEISILIFGIVAFACLIGNISFGSSLTYSSWLSDVFASKSWMLEGSAADIFFTSLQWAAIGYLIGYGLGEALGLSEANIQAASMAGLWGGLAGGALGASTAGSGSWAWWTTGPGAITAGIIIAITVYYFTQESYKVVTFNCNSWDAQTGGDDCELCNNQVLPCSEYQCRSLGQACELINRGTEEELCVHININDAEYPIIEPWEEALDSGFAYTPDNAISPPNRGVQVIYSDSANHCIPAFTPLKFGITLNEPGKCKVDYLRKPDYDSMELMLSSGATRYNHTIQFSVPGVEALTSQGLEIQNDGNYELYVRCQDSNGNVPPADFVFKYCMDPEPDLRAPYIDSTSVLNNMPVAFNQESLDVVFYINEISECKWSHQDESFENMQETMSCASDLINDVTYINSRSVYPCSTTLTGIQNQKINSFYIRCKDKPFLIGTDNENDRNVNTQSYQYNVIGTKDLVIDQAGPNETKIKDSTTDIKVTLTAKTSAGFKEGEASCSYSPKGQNNYVRFLNTNSYTHSTDLYLEEGEYEYDIKCVDLGGNADIVSIEFEAESDSEPPTIVRAYKSDNSLKIVTEESAECVYDVTSCNYLFTDGIPMIRTEGINHFVDWSTKTKFYIKCKDEYGNEPNSNECSSIVKAID